MSRSRGWCFTINNPKEEDEKNVKKIDYSYIIVGKEIGEQGTEHLQGYVYFKNQRSLKSVSKKIPRAHLEVARGNTEQNVKYCSKDGVWFEDGDRPKQGARIDLDEIGAAILKGDSTVDEIAQNNPMAYHQYGRTMEKLEDIRLKNLKRDGMTEGIWIWGKTGVGKSHEAYRIANECESYYVWANDNGWQDGYTGQECVIIDDFRGSIKYEEILKLVDKWEYSLKRRNRCPMPFVSRKVIITSSMPPEDIYCNLNERDSLEQLYRRYEVIELKNDSEVLRG